MRPSISFHSLPRLVLALASSLLLTEIGAKANTTADLLWIDAIEIREQPEPDVTVVALSGSLPTPCHSLGWEVAEEAIDGVLHIQAWFVNSGDICTQVLHPFSADIPLGSTLFDTVAVNGVTPADLSAPKAPLDVGLEPEPFFRSGTPPTSTPGPLPLAAALAGWHTARRLRRRCKGAQQ